MRHDTGLAARAARGAFWVACGALVLLSAAGCQGKAPPLTADEKANFQGGPMPEEVRRQMEEHNRKMQQQRSQPAPPPPPPATP